MVLLVSLPTMVGSGELLVAKETTIAISIAVVLLVPLMLPEPLLMVFSLGQGKILSLPLHFWDMDHLSLSPPSSCPWKRTLNQ